MAAERDERQERVYLPFGHGREHNTTDSRVPDGCSVTVLETCGGIRLWNRIGEEVDYMRIKEWIARNPEKRHIFSDPMSHTAELNDIFGSVAVYGPGKKYPNIQYGFPLLWTKKNQSQQNVVDDVTYSGVIPLAALLESEFTTTNIVTKLKTMSGEFANPERDTYPYMGKYSRRLHDICHHNQNEIYKYSIYPSSQQEPGGYHIVSLKDLMASIPGHYIHFACRTTNQSARIDHRSNPYAETNHTIEEIYTMRIPGMSQNQRSIAIQRMEENERATDREEKRHNPQHEGYIRTQKHLHSTYNRHSSKNNSTIRLAALRKNRLQKEIRAKVPKKGGTRKRRKH
jgi:hypothetical protein